VPLAQSLGRQKRADDLIRRGCAAFEIEITLSGGPDQPDVVVHRRTERASGGAQRPRKRRHVSGGKRGKAAAVAGDGSNDSDSDGGSHDDDDDEGGRGGGGGSRTCHTTWQIGGQAATEARIKELSRSMGIHFDNLCQFLPQVRYAWARIPVAPFWAGCGTPSAQELLQGTIRSTTARIRSCVS
jgi:hypothetical protein